jgi:hypothetical protein
MKARMDLFIRQDCAGNGENRTGEPRLQHQTIAVPETHRRGIALSLPPLSVQNALACQKPTSKPIKQSNAAYRGR